jgi:hypothetical protein
MNKSSEGNMVSHSSGRAAAQKTMGLESLVALVVGSFSMTRLTAAAFQIDPPAANPTPLVEWHI